MCCGLIAAGLAGAACNAQLLVAPSPTFQTTSSSPCGATDTKVEHGRSAPNVIAQSVATNIDARTVAGATSFALGVDGQNRRFVSMVCSDVFPRPVRPGAGGCSERVEHLMSLGVAVDEPCLYQVHGELQQPTPLVQGEFTAQLTGNANFWRSASLQFYPSVAALEQLPGTGQPTGLLQADITTQVSFRLLCTLTAAAAAAPGGTDHAVSAAVSLTMTPVHTTQPETVVSCLGEPVSFTVVATGTTAREWQIGTNQWAVLNPGPLVSGGVTVGSVELSADGDTVTLTPATSPEAAAYWRNNVRIRRMSTLSNGWVYSRVARLLINAADVGRAGGLIGGDGELDNNDFIAFINQFMSGSLRMDIGASGGRPGTDGVLDNNDFVAFIDLFFRGGC